MLSFLSSFSLVSVSLLYQMKNETSHITSLVSKYLSGTLTAVEEIRLNTWLSEDEDHRKLFDYLTENNSRILEDLAFFKSLDVDASWKRLLKQINSQSRPTIAFRIIRYAMVVLMGLSVTWFYFNNRGAARKEDKVLSFRQGKDVSPGGNKAVLILSDNHRVVLHSDTLAFAECDGTAIVNEPGALTYNQRRINKHTSLLYNTLLIPKTGMYRVTLSDGTRVWVNAFSELKFPVQFGKDERKVFLKGEAYFEVSHDAGKPFLVEVNGSVVQVLGTRFNINSYNGVKATLVEGAVKIIHGDQSALLKPGQEAHIADTIAVGEASVGKAIAWKNGDFYFKRDSIEEIMDQLSRWYGISVDYQGVVPERLGYNGRIRRDVNLSEVLSMLAFATGAEFTMTNTRKVTVNYRRNRNQYH